MIFDISDPANPQFVKNAGISVSTRPERGALAIKDNYLYCAFMGEKVIKKFDLTDPLNIKQVAEFTGVTSDLKKVVVTDRYVIAGNGSNTARWVDTTGSAEEPAVVSVDATFDLGNVFHIVRSGDYIYCMDRDGQIRMYDSTAEPGGNGRIGNLVNANNMKDSSDNKNYDEQALTMDEAGYLYGINGNMLTVYDAGENSRDFFTEGNYNEYQFEELADTRDCFVRAGSLYVLSASNQVTIFDVSDPMNPVLKNSGVGVNADGGYVNGEYLYLTLPGGPQSGEKLCTYRFVQTVQSDGSNTVQQLPLTITGKASGCETVAVSVDDGEATTVPVQNGKWSYTVETLSAGYHTVKAAIPDTSAAETMEIYMPEALVRDFAFSASALTGGETLTVNCTVTNLGSNAMRPLLMIGLFKNGELVDVGLQQADVPGSGAQAMTASIELPEDVSGCTAQAFIWSDGQTIRPLSSSIEIQ